MHVGVLMEKLAISIRYWVSVEIAFGTPAASRGRALQQLKVHTSAQNMAETYGKPQQDPLQSSVWASGPHLGPYYVFRNVLLNRNGSLTFFDQPGTALAASDLESRSRILPGSITKRPSMLEFPVHIWDAPNPQGHAGCHQFIKVAPQRPSHYQMWSPTKVLAKRMLKYYRTSCCLSASSCFRFSIRQGSPDAYNTWHNWIQPCKDPTF